MDDLDEMEILAQTKDGFVWMQVCARGGCCSAVDRKGGKYCHLHSKWYRPILLPFQKLANIFKRNDADGAPSA